ncbi:MAG: DUF2384 domain-containing protein [Alcanivoracaceae bacterium]|nr:DUF2384 domain-containing protein [Alcanivoracaceae bacterium]
MIVENIESLLGGSSILGNTINTEMDLYELSKVGIPKIALVSLVKNINTSMRAMSEILHVTERTLQRKKDQDLLSENISEHVIQIAEVYMRGSQVFGNNDAFEAWMKAPSKAFANRKPKELLSSRYGVHIVLDELGRIEHGIFS